MGITNDWIGKGLATRYAAATLITLPLLSGCAPEVGSEAWCKQMSEKPKADWSANNTADYARHCIFRGSGNG